MNKRRKLIILISALSCVGLIFLLVIPLMAGFNPIIGIPSLNFPIQDSGNITDLNGFNVPNWGEPGKNHNGMDLIIASNNYTTVISPVSGIVISIQDSINPYGGNLLLSIDIMVNYEWRVSIVFEPGDNRTALNNLQRSLINVQVLQVVRVGDVIGTLLDSGSNAHLHYMISHTLFGPQCPYQYSSSSARATFETLAAMASETLCYPGLNSDAVQTTTISIIVILTILGSIIGVSLFLIIRKRRRK